MGKRCKKYLSRMAAASICGVMLCLALTVSATFALFQVSVSNEGSVLGVGSFSAVSQTVVKSAPLSQESPTVIPTDAVCADGEYYLDIVWRGNTDGHLRIVIDYPAAAGEEAAVMTLAAAPEGEEGTENTEASDENGEAARLVYILNLPLSALTEADPEQEYNIRIPLTLHEGAVVTTESVWGLYVPTEEDEAVLLTPDDVTRFIEEGGISFGRPFESSVTLLKKEEAPVDGAPALQPEVIGEDVDEAKVYEPGMYELTIDWTPYFDAYCVLDLIPADENSPLKAEKHIVRLSAAEESEGENIVVTIPVEIYENVKITAITVKGTTDNARPWPEKEPLTFGRHFAVESTMTPIPVTDSSVFEPLGEAAYPVGTYQLKLDWNEATADGYCVITVGDERWYVTGTVEEGADKDRFILLQLLKDAAIAVEVKQGPLPEELKALEGESIIAGASFDPEIVIAPVTGEEPEYDALSGEAYTAGSYVLKLNWPGATVDGYCVITVGDETYYVSCPVADAGTERVITLQLKKDAVIAVQAEKGSVPEGQTALIGDMLVCGTEFKGAATLAVKPEAGEEAAYGKVDPDLTYAAGTYLLSLDWEEATANGYILITVTTPAEEDSEAVTQVWYLACTAGQDPRIIELTLSEGASVRVEYVKGSYSGDAAVVPEDGKLVFTVPAESGSTQNDDQTEGEPQPEDGNEDETP